MTYSIPPPPTPSPPPSLRSDIATPASSSTSSRTSNPQRAGSSTPAPNARLSIPSRHPNATATATAQQPLRLDTNVHGASSVAQRSSTKRAESSSSSFQQAEDIEMEPITPGGHRRRKSSLMNPVNSIHGPRTTRPRGASILSLTGGRGEEPKILEEDGAAQEELTDEDEAGLTDEDLHNDEETGLTTEERRRKEKKRRRNTRLDNRIMREKITKEEKKEVDQDIYKQIMVNAVLIGLWYLFSLSISLYNKWMFDTNKLNFPFPMFTTSIHMMVQFSLACLVLYFIPSLRPSHGHKSDLGQSRHEAERESPIMTKMFYLTRIGPCGAATSLDIGLGNTSLKFITLTFYTMCKSSALAFVLFFAFLFRLETPNWKLVGIIALMTVGVVMMVAGEVEFKLGGFLLVISAAFFSGFRWGLTQILLLRNPATSNPFSSIFFLAPIMFVTLTAIAIPVEGFFDLLKGLGELSQEWGAVYAPLLILFPGVIAFLMTASEFALLQRTSVVTLSIAGIFKEVVTISTAAVVFDDKLTSVNISGLFVTIGAIAAYNYVKFTKMRQEAQSDAHRGHAEGAFSSRSNSASDGENEGEEAGLLRRSVDEEDELSGERDGDVIPKIERSPMGGG